MSGITFDASGSAQQVTWAQTALDELCTYPFRQAIETTDATVLVKWVDALPGHTDSTHPYMVTEVTGERAFLILIPKWADDSTAPEFQGLPDPIGQVEPFYKEAFIHELGHVVTYLTIDLDDVDPQDNSLVIEVCSFFWRAAIGGSPPVIPTDGMPEVTLYAGAGMTGAGAFRRYGTSDDWEGPIGHPALAWPDEIRESVAEVFKMLYTNEPLIFGNRTNWHISVHDAIQLATLLGHSVSGTYTDTVRIWDGDPLDGGVVIASFSQELQGTPEAALLGWVFGLGAVEGLTFDNFRVVNGDNQIIFSDSFGSDDSASYSLFPPNAVIGAGVLDFSVPGSPVLNALIADFTTTEDFTSMIEVVRNDAVGGGIPITRANTPISPFLVTIFPGEDQIFVFSQLSGPSDFVSVTIPYWITDSVVYANLDVPIYESDLQVGAPLRGSIVSRARLAGRAPVVLVNPLTMTDQAAVAQALLDAGKKITAQQRRALIWQRAQEYRAAIRLGLSPTQKQTDAFNELQQGHRSHGFEQKMNPGTLRGALRS